MIRKRLISVISAMVLVLSLFTLLPEGVLRAEALGDITGLTPYYSNSNYLKWDEYSGASYYKVKVESRVLNRTYTVTEPKFIFKDIFTEKGIIYKCTVTAYNSGNIALTNPRTKTVCLEAKLTNVKINDDLTMTWDEFTGEYEEMHANISLNGRTGSVPATPTGANLKPYLEDKPSGRYQIWVIAKVDSDHTLYSDYYYLDFESSAVFVTSNDATVTKPKEGMTPADTQLISLVLNGGDINTNEAVKRAYVSWKDENDRTMKNTDVFEGGKKYTAIVSVSLIGIVHLDFNTDYYKYETSSINGIKTTILHSYGDQSYEFAVEMTVTKPVKNISIEVTAPKAGEKPNYLCDYDETKIGIWGDVREGDDSSINEWSEDGTALTSSDTFKDGHTYTARLRIYPKNGLEFADNMTVTIGGKAAKFIKTTVGRKRTYYVYEVSFTLSSGSRLVGDANGSGDITADDAIIVARMAAGYGDYSAKYDADVADMNQDGKVTADDAIIIARYSANYGDYRTRYTKYI